MQEMCFVKLYLPQSNSGLCNIVNLQLVVCPILLARLLGRIWPKNAQDMCCLAENPRLVKRKWTRQYCDGYSSQMLVASSCLSFFTLSQWIAFFLHEMSINTEQFQTKTESAKQIQIAGCLSSHVLSQLGSCKDCQGCGAHWIVVNVSERF